MYLLWAGINGYSYSTDQFRMTMNAFLEAIGCESPCTIQGPLNIPNAIHQFDGLLLERETNTAFGSVEYVLFVGALHV